MISKNNKVLKLALAIVFLCAIVCGMLFVYQHNKPQTLDGDKNITVVVTHSDGESKNFNYNTDAEYLGEAITENEDIGVIGENGVYGLYIKEVDGESASDEDQTYWAISKNNVMLEVGADNQPIADGESYELVLMKW